MKSTNYQSYHVSLMKNVFNKIATALSAHILIIIIELKIINKYIIDHLTECRIWMSDIIINNRILHCVV